MPNDRLITKEKILKQHVTQKEVKAVLTHYNIRLLEKYYFGKYEPRSIENLGQLLKISETIDKISHIEDLKKTHVCNFSEWECHILIVEGDYDMLVNCIRCNCLSDMQDRFNFRLLKNNIEAYIKDRGLCAYPKEVKKITPDEIKKIELKRKLIKKDLATLLTEEVPAVNHEKVDAEVKHIKETFNEAEQNLIVLGLKKNEKEEETELEK